MTVHVEARESSSSPGARTHGVVFVHACPRAVSPHLQWALSRLFGSQVAIDWSDQPVAPGNVRAEVIWTGPAGMGARIASALLAFTQVRYEVTEDPSPGRPGERFAATPSLGLFRGDIGAHGDVLVSEDRLRSALSQAAVTGGLAEEIARLIGEPWDAELEPFRCAQAASNVRVLHEVV